MIIDSHQHFWKYNPARDRWITEDMESIRKDFLPSHLESTFKKNNVDGCISIQADQSEEETHFLLQLSKENNFIKGVVGWVDLCSKTIDESLQCFSRFETFCGVRHIIQAEPKGFMLRKDFQNGIEQLSKYDLTYDILVHRHQLPEVIAFVSKFPNQPFVMDHLGKPAISSKEFKDWRNDIETLAKFQNVHCKISGMVTEADWNHWKQSDFTPYLDTIFKAFGTNRTLYGSDWPVCLLAAEYDEQINIVKNHILPFSPDEKAAIMSKNTIRLYSR